MWWGVWQAHRPCPQSMPPTHVWREPSTPGAPCPTARSLPVDDLVVNTFEQQVQQANLTEDHILYFPKYGE